MSSLTPANPSNLSTSQQPDSEVSRKILTASVSNSTTSTTADSSTLKGSNPSGASSNLSELEIRAKFTQGLVSLLRPAVVSIDQEVQHVRVSQVQLRQQIDALIEDLQKVSEEKAVPLDLEPHVKKLNNAKRRVMLVNNILQNVEERVRKLHQNILREQAQHPRSGSIQPVLTIPPLPSSEVPSASTH